MDDVCISCSINYYHVLFVCVDTKSTVRSLFYYYFFYDLPVTAVTSVFWKLLMTTMCVISTDTDSRLLSTQLSDYSTTTQRLTSEFPQINIDTLHIQ